MPAEELLAHYARRALSPVEVLKAVTERIARLNPGINAFAVMNPRSLEAAGDSEARWRAGRPRGALDGVPVDQVEIRSPLKSTTVVNGELRDVHGNLLAYASPPAAPPPQTSDDGTAPEPQPERAVAVPAKKPGNRRKFLS